VGLEWAGGRACSLAQASLGFSQSPRQPSCHTLQGHDDPKREEFKFISNKSTCGSRRPEESEQETEDTIAGRGKGRHAAATGRKK